MSKATKCDRCGSCYEHGGRSIRQGFGANMVEFDLCADCAEAFDAWMEFQPVTDAPERVTESGEMEHETRDKLEDDVREFSYQDPNLHTSELVITHAPMDTVLGWLDCQAEITRREVLCQPDERDEQIAELEAEIATLKEHRAGNVERLHELTDECAELRKYRDEWRGLAEKYRADSIAAQAETERYRAKLGDVLDAIHEAERAAR